jgi:hypothetical protein
MVTVIGIALSDSGLSIYSPEFRFRIPTGSAPRLANPAEGYRRYYAPQPAQPALPPEEMVQADFRIAKSMS